MSEEIRVSIEPDRGTKNQWAKGFFYRNDGKKRTLVPKKLLIAGGGGFFTIVISLLLQGSPEEVKPAHASGISAPTELQSERMVNVPIVNELNSSTTASSQTTHTETRSQKNKYPRPHLILRPRPGKIPPGSIVKATLLTGASNGSVRAEIGESLNVAGETYIEEGSIVVGSGRSGEDRLDIRFTQLVSKDGAVESIDAQACDGEDKTAGIRGSKVGGKALKLLTGIGLNFAGGMTESLQETDGQNGVLVRRPNMRNALLNGAATAALDESKETMTDIRNKPPVIEVPAGTSIYIFFQGN